jgi:hypothetical protein
LPEQIRDGFKTIAGTIAECCFFEVEFGFMMAKAGNSNELVAARVQRPQVC